MVLKLWCLYFIVAVVADNLLPEIQLDLVGGQLGFAGDYAGLSPYKEPSQFETLYSSSIILSEIIDNTAIFKSFATINGSIETYCQLTDSEFILAGNFITINETIYNHIARFSSQSRQFSTLGQGLDGAVRSIYCTADAIYVGGDFMAPINANVSQYSGHAASYANNQWSPLPWKGFNGPVYSIINNTQQNSIIFGGQFDSTGDGQYANANSSWTTQMVNMDSSVTISSGNGLASSDPRSVICNQAPWLLQDGNTGYWQAQFVFPIQPSMFRLSNVHSADGKNTNTFKQYFTLSYLDPVTNQIVTCSEECSLSSDPNVSFQDFTVVNTASTSGVRISIDTWYGAAGGLGGVSIFHSDGTLQPNVVTNSSVTSSPCAAATADAIGDSAPSSSAVSTTGTWTKKYAWGIYQTFLVSVVPATELHTTDVSATYKPYIPAQGVYKIYATTPGCVGTATCDQRVLMQLTIELTPGNTTTYALDQNIMSDERTLIYTGPVSASSSTFQPSIVMKVDPSATTSSLSNITIMGTSLEFVKNSAGAMLSSVLNYYPSNNTWTALAEQLPVGSVVHSLKSVENTLYIGGQFNMINTTAFSNIVAYDFGSSAFAPLTQGGVNGAVYSLLLANNSDLIVAGAFNNTAVPQVDNTLNHVAIYNTQSHTWSAMNQGVNGHVNALYATRDQHIHLSGSFNSTTSGAGLYNNAEWDPSTQSWVAPTSYILGRVTNQVQFSDTATLYLGAIRNAQSYRASNMASLASNSVMSPITEIDPNAVVHTGAFWRSHTETCVILAGAFSINNTSYPLVIYRNKAWQGLLQHVQGHITTLSVVQDNLFIGGKFNGTAADNMTATSIAFYNLESQTMQAIAGVFDSNHQPGLVNAIYPQGDAKSIYVGGHFSFAGMLNCDGICILSVDTRQWTQPNQGVSGAVNDMYLDSNSRMLTVVGDLTINQSARTPLASIDTSSSMAVWNAAPPDDRFPLPTSLLYDNNNRFIISGTRNNATYVAMWDGQVFSAVEANLGASSVINQLLWMPIEPASARSVSRYPADSQSMLMAAGHLVLPNSNTSCSAALFDGTAWHPYLLSATNVGAAGRVDQIFTASDCCNASYKNRRYLSVPAVILISIAISLGILFLLVACAFVYLFLKRRNNPHKYYANPIKEWKPKYRPTSLLAMVDAANLDANDAAAAAAPGASMDTAASASNMNKQADTKTTGYSTALDSANGSPQRGQTSMDMSDTATARYRHSSGFSSGLGLPFATLMAHALENNEKSVAATEDSPKVFYARYPFDAKEFGELAFEAKTPIVVTDTSDNVWWMGYKDDGAGNPVSGLFPSNYVTKSKPN
ncbi:cortical protein marker for cell polarity-domain-containing protein [Parasitella parasitica]|nr:cortical protein marker for cell polarity-domain-containing protein [Parasitella parasitica]